MLRWLGPGMALFVALGAAGGCGDGEETEGSGTGGTAGSGGSSAVGGTGPSGGSGGATGGAAGVDAGDGSAGMAGADASLDGSQDAPPDVLLDVGGTEVDFDPNAYTQNDTAFPVGIQSGDVTYSSGLLWTFYYGGNPLEVRVYEPSTAGKVIQYYAGAATPSADGFVHADVSPLPAHRELFYVFLEKSGETILGRSPVGRFVTAPLPGQKPVVEFGGTSCLKNSKAPFETLPQAAKLNLDFFILGGDNSYNDSATTLSQYRTLWQNQLAEPSYRSLLVNTSHYATWDDHEVDNDYNPETINKQRLADAKQSFFEYLAVRPNAANPGRLWRKYAWGDTLEVFVLDCRSERKPSTASGANAEYISKAQMTWLKDGLQKSTATFKILVNSVPITNFPLLFDVAQGDRWEGYPAQRKELLDFIDQNAISGVLFIAGDFHLGASARVEPSGASSLLREILVGPGDNDPNPIWATLGAPQFEFRTDKSNVVHFVANPNATPPSITVTFLGGSGNQLFAKTYFF